MYKVTGTLGAPFEYSNYVIEYVLNKLRRSFSIMKSLSKKSVTLIIITVLFMVFIFVQSALPGPLSGAESGFIVDILYRLTGADRAILTVIVRKGAHFTEYLILGFLAALDVEHINMEKQAGLSRFKRFIIAWAIATLYAVTDEIHQAFVPERACAFTDVCIDSAGAIIGIGCQALCTKVLKK